MISLHSNPCMPRMIEFTTSNFNENGYCDAHYRRSVESVELSDYGESIRVPARLEVMDSRGEWRQHPVVFVHYGSAEEERLQQGQLVIFCEGGNYMSTLYRPRLGDPRKATLEEARKLGLTEGDTRNVKVVVREEE